VPYANQVGGDYFSPTHTTPGAALIVPTFHTDPDPGERGSHEWWRDRLLSQMSARRVGIEVCEDYYLGVQRLAFATGKFREAFGKLFSELADSWCEIIVDAAVERLVINGFRFGQTADGGGESDPDAEAVWQRNGLDAASVVAHTTAVAAGVAYLVVGPHPKTDAARIIVEHPLRAHVETDVADPRDRLAGIHVYVDEPKGVEVCRVWLPDSWVEYQRRALTTGTTMSRPWSRVDGGANRLREVPIVPLANKQGHRTPDGRSDLAGILSMQDAVNKLVTDMLVASEFAAFPQRWATGIEVPTDPVTGAPLANGFSASVSRLWMTENNLARFGDFQVADLGNYTRAADMLVQHIAAQTRTPPHYLLGQVVNASGDALKAAETGLVMRVKRKMLAFGDAWEDAMRLALALDGKDDKAAMDDAETIWADPETRTEGERIDGITKLASVGVPRQALWARIPGVTPKMIKAWTAMAEEEAQQAATAAAAALALMPGEASTATATPGTPPMEASPPTPPPPGAPAA
jgi:hypothetical protein